MRHIDQDVPDLRRGKHVFSVAFALVGAAAAALLAWLAWLDFEQSVVFTLAAAAVCAGIGRLADASGPVARALAALLLPMPMAGAAMAVGGGAWFALTAAIIVGFPVSMVFLFVIAVATWNGEGGRHA